MVYARELNLLFSQRRKREISLKLFMQFYLAILEGGELSPEDSIFFSLLSITCLGRVAMDLTFYDLLSLSLIHGIRQTSCPGFSSEY